MNTSQKLFLLAVEDMNFTKTAAKAFVTQQCISEHIRRLENQYGASLFQRRPSLKLTPAGELLYKTLLEVNLLEANLDTQIKMVTEGMKGSVRIGINDSRLMQLFPRFFHSYHDRYPNIDISFIPGETVNQKKAMKNGELDMILGVDSQYDVQFKFVYMVSDQLYFVISRRLFLEHFPEWENRIHEFTINGFSAAHIANIPVSMNLSSSTNYQAVSSALNAAYVTPNCILQTSNYDVQLNACCDMMTAAFFPTIMVAKILKYNRTLEPNSDRELLIFSIPEITSTLRVDCILHQKPQYPAYINDLVLSLKQACEQYHSEVSNHLAQTRQLK